MESPRSFWKWLESLNRDWIKQGEGKLTVLQIFGLVCIAVGVLFLLVMLLSKENLNYSAEAVKVAIAFLIIILGIVFAFPGLLQDHSKKWSTMRIVVFMFMAVLCALLLKVGWNQSSLSAIGFDGYWLAAFVLVLAAKALQTYFEVSRKESIEGIQEAVSFTTEQIAQMAVEQNQGELYAAYLNIESLSDTIRDGESCVTIYVEDDRVQQIPSKLLVHLSDGSTIEVKTEIVPDMGGAEPHIGQAISEISDSRTDQYFGSVCCLIRSKHDANFLGLVSAGHVFTHGNFYNYGGYLPKTEVRSVKISDYPNGALSFQRMQGHEDIAIVDLAEQADVFNDYISFKDGYYDVTKNDVKTALPNVVIASRKSHKLPDRPTKRDAYILDENVSFRIQYRNEKKIMRRLVVIGNTNDLLTSRSVSVGGDSGCCVYHKKSGNLIGLLVGGNKKFSFVLPIKESLESHGFIIQ